MAHGNKKSSISPIEKVTDSGSSRDVVRGVWELARLHTREAWLCWYPAGQYGFRLGKHLLTLAYLSMGCVFVGGES